MHELAPESRESPSRRARVVVGGRVQGVGFRAYVLGEASTLPVAGWVRNRLDGRVEALVEGAAEAVEILVERMRAGPTFSRVDEVQVEWEPWVGDLEGFEVRR